MNIAAVLMLFGYNIWGNPVTQSIAVFASMDECKEAAQAYKAVPEIHGQCVTPETAKLNGWKP